MPAHAFRALTLRMPAVTGGSHVENADFRVGITPTSRGKIFATLPSQHEFGSIGDILIKEVRNTLGERDAS